MEVAISGFGNTASISHPDNEIVRLPSSTVFALSEAGGAQRLDAGWDRLLDAAGSSGSDIDARIAEFEAKTGLRLPDDLRTLLGDNVLLAVDANGLTAEALRNGDLQALNAGLRFTSDPKKLAGIYAKVHSAVVGQTHSNLPVVKSTTSDGMVLASNGDYAKTLAGLHGTLGDTPEFQSVADDASSEEAVFFFDWDRVEAQILSVARAAGAPAELLDNLRPLRALGATSSVHGGYTTETLRLSLND